RPAREQPRLRRARRRARARACPIVRGRRRLGQCPVSLTRRNRYTRGARYTVAIASSPGGGTMRPAALPGPAVLSSREECLLSSLQQFRGLPREIRTLIHLCAVGRERDEVLQRSQAVRTLAGI